MPFETESLIKIRKELINKANSELQNKLGSFLEAAELVQLAEDLEERIF